MKVGTNSPDKLVTPGGIAAFDDVVFTPGDLYTAAEWYDVDYAGYMAEDAFYRMLVERFVKPGGALVELGAGTGRLCIGYAVAGARVHAVEPALPMLERLVSKADRQRKKLQSEPSRAPAAAFSKPRSTNAENMGQVTGEQAIARDFVGPNDARTDLVTFPFNGMLHIHTREELVESYRHIHARLAAGGRFAFDITAPYWDAMSRVHVNWGRLDERVHPDTGRKIFTCDRARYAAERKVLVTDFRFVELGEKVGVDLQIQQRMWTFQEVQSALLETGFEIELRFGDVDLVPFSERSPRLLLCAKKI